MPTLVEDFQFILGGNAHFQKMVRETLPLCTDAERRMLLELASVADQKLKEAEPQIAELQKMFNASLGELNAGIEEDQAALAGLQKRLEELQAKLAEVPAEPAAPPAPPLPGMGDPAYGRRLADELLGLAGPGTGAAAAPGDPGDVWELTSSDWKIDDSTKGTAKPAAPHAGQAPPPAEPRRKGKSEDLWELESQDWQDRPDQS